MCTLYLDCQGSVLGRRGGRLVLSADQIPDREVPVEQVERVLVYGQVQITTAALGTLLQRGIPLTLLNSRGWLHGHLVPDIGGQVRRRARQYALMQSPEAALLVARLLIAAKLRNRVSPVGVRDRGAGEILA